MNTKELMQSRGDLDVSRESIEGADILGRLQSLQADVGPGGIPQGESFGGLLLCRFRLRMGALFAGLG